MIDVVIIGGGINGLVAATALARDKRSVLVLDQRETIGGAAVTASSPNGFKTPTLSHSLGPLSGDVVSTLRLGGARSKLNTCRNTPSRCGAIRKTRPTAPSS